MDKYGIIGNPLGHSFSKKYFTDKFESEGIDAQFLNYEISSIQELSAILKEETNLRGFCVTIPYKQEIIRFLDEIEPLAKKIGAVNSVQIIHDGNQIKLKGFNTDIFGFSESLKIFLGKYRPKALILGTGGASKAVAKGLEELDINYRFVSRFAQKGILSYGMLTSDIMEEHKLIVNCSPSGTFPNENTCPDIPYPSLTSEHFLYDLVYNPAETLFLKKGKEHGAKTHNGLKMLHLQAEKSWGIWNSLF